MNLFKPHSDKLHLKHVAAADSCSAVQKIEIFLFFELEQSSAPAHVKRSWSEWGLKIAK